VLSGLDLNVQATEHFTHPDEPPATHEAPFNVEVFFVLIVPVHTGTCSAATQTLAAEASRIDVRKRNTIAPCLDQN